MGSHRGLQSPNQKTRRGAQCAIHLMCDRCLGRRRSDFQLSHNARTRSRRPHRCGRRQASPRRRVHDARVPRGTLTRLFPRLVRRSRDYELQRTLQQVHPRCVAITSTCSSRHIFKDHYTGTESGRSPGYGVTLLAETVNHYNYCAEMMGVNGALAEELGVACSELLLEEIARGGCIDSIHQPLAVLLMAFSPEDVSKIRTGPLTTTTVGVGGMMGW